MKISDRPAKASGLASILVAFLFLIPLFSPMQSFSASLPATYSLSFGWDANPDTSIAGYRLYFGTTSGSYTNSVDLGNVTTATVSRLSSGVTYYFAVTAYDSGGQESAFSGELSYIQGSPGVQMQIHGGANGQFVLKVNGPASHSYDIEATQDFKAWTVIGTATADTNGSFDFTDTNTANFSKRFYRTRDNQP